MIHEWRRYRLKAGMAQPYLQLLADRGLPLVTRHLPLMGYWLAESGTLNVIHHLWSYESWSARDAARRALSAETDWTQGFIPQAFAMVEEQDNCFLRLTAGSPAFENALSQRQRPDGLTHSSQELFAPDYAGMTEGDAPADAVACFSPLSGTGAKRALLARSAEPLGFEGQDAAHIILRPLGFSPL